MYIVYLIYYHKKDILSINSIGGLMVSFQIILISVLCVGAGFLAFFVIKTFIAPKKIGNIQALLKQGKNSAAIKVAKALLAKNSRDFAAHYYLGSAYLADNKHELALMEFKVVNQNAIFDVMDIPEAEFRKQCAQLYAKFNQPEDAIKEYILLTKLEPTNAENFYNAGVIFEKKNKAEHALNYYQKAIQLNRKHVKAHASRGMILYRAKQYAEARKAIDHAISLSPDTFSTYFYLGKILKEGKDYAGAVNAFEKSMRDPDSRQKSLIERGTCYMAAKNIEKATDEFERAIKASKNDASQETLFARYFLASCYEQQRKIDLAIVQWNLIHSKNKKFRDVPSKLTEYSDLQSNDSIKEYLTCSDGTFVEICTAISQTSLGFSPKDVSSTKFGCKIIATEQKSGNWMNTRQQLFLLLFYRDPELIEDTVVRSLVEEVKKQNYSKGIICTNSGFTRTAMTFAENRPVELFDKEKLQQLLDKAGM